MANLIIFLFYFQRTMTEQQRDSLINEFNGLNLNKFIQEAVTNLVDAKMKVCKQTNKKSNLFSSTLRNGKRLLYNKLLRRIKPSKLLDLVEKDWQSSKMNFSVRPHAKTEIQSVLTEVGFSSIEIYDFNGKLTETPERSEACFLVRKPRNAI